MDRLALLLHLGDPALIVPAALGIGAWLALAGAWRAAICWLLLFGAALGVVGADKVAFLGWGGGVPALDYRAASGHAAGAAALWPMLLALLMPRWRRAAAAAGLGISLLMVALLVALDEHSLAEALAGWTIGAIASVTALYCGPAFAFPTLAGPPLAGSPLDLRPLVWPQLALPPFVLPPLACHLAGIGVFVAAALLLRAAPTGYWLIKTALLLSGQRHLFPLHC